MKAYYGENTGNAFAAEATDTVTIVAGQTTTKPIALTVVSDTRTGTFSYKIAYPAGTTGTLTLAGATPYSDALSGDSPKVGSFDTVNIGQYTLTIALKKGTQGVGKTVAVHIYKNMETRVDYIFVADDLIDLPVAPSVTVTPQNESLK